MSTFHQQLMQFTVPERAEIAAYAGFTLNYLHKTTYANKGAPKFHFDNALALDVASKGALPFYQHTAGCIDWDLVRRRLNRAKRKGLI